MINNVKVLQSNDLEKLFQEGERFFNENNISKAKVNFEQIIAADPQNFEALNNLGVIHFKEGQLQQATYFFRRALELYEDYSESLENLAICLEKNGDYAEAAKNYEKILKSGNNKPEIFISTINCHLHSGEFSPAKALLDNLVRSHGYEENIRLIAEQLIHDLRNILHSGKHSVEKIAKFYIDEGNLATARDILIPALKRRPNDKELQNLKKLLCTKEKLKRLPIAIISASDLLEKDPARKLRWGDHWFGKELAEALSTEGAVISGKEPKVLIHLHGIPINKVEEPTYNIIWIHSHPDMITPQSLSLYDHIFCLSPQFLEKIRAMEREGELLIGGTAKQPPPGVDELSHDIVFVANGKQGQGRRIIHDLISLGNRWIDLLEVWGEGWEGILPEKCIRGIYFDNQKLSDLYASSRVVLNDHHEDMRREGFLNPRILDVMASGGVVISDSLPNAKEIFGEALLTYTSPVELDQILHRLFADNHHREKIKKLGLEAAAAYSFKSTAQKIIQHIAAIDDVHLEKRAKNLYMEKVWAPVKGKLDTDRIRRLKEVTAEQCEGATLDVGCANGDSTAIMKRNNPSLDLTGLELTDWGYQEAVKNHPELRFVQGDAEELPFPDQSYDTVVLDHIIEHFSDPVALILEAKRVARKRVIIGIPIMHLNDPDHKIAWRLDDFRNLLFGFFPTLSIRGMREPDGIEVSNAVDWNFVVGTGYLEGNNRKEIPIIQPLTLHLGCGQRRLEGFLNIDIMPSSAVDLLCDSRRLPFPAGTVSRIETYHMIEHLPRHDFLEALFEWNRVLEEGGTLAIECPDFDATIKEYMEGKRFRINNIFGLQRHPGDYHLFGYTFEDLAETLQGLGFRDIRQESPTDYHAPDEPSLRITALKVHHVQRPADIRGFSIQYTHQNYAKAIESEQKRKKQSIKTLPKGPIKLDICGGEFPYGNGFLNVDIRPLPNVDIVADVAKGLNFADHIVDEILSCGTLEHFYIPTVLEILKEMWRVLKPGGKLTVGVPNLKAILYAYQQGEMDFQLFNQYVYGSVQKDVNPYNVHRSLWDAERMINAMTKAGFTNVAEQPYDLPFHIPKYMLKVVGIA
jgi:predicted SAM-dependent methyltransferase